ncbi:hypothetical protein Nepgr_004704 [Nepenthes gracilis]|uniref:Uncharacterized protein n=1 Tax=Nepenthes gracilis TaxID=150966 RepID=A0AAD3XFK7_NEPGR|nr:hypothetical protein Nepgr_004704 [Nepenthes gracilis]
MISWWQRLKSRLLFGAKQGSEITSWSAIVNQGANEKAVRQKKADEEAEEMRSRAKKLREMSWRATENGGSSYSCISTLVEGLSSYHLLLTCG